MYRFSNVSIPNPLLGEGAKMTFSTHEHQSTIPCEYEIPLFKHLADKAAKLDAETAIIVGVAIIHPDLQRRMLLPMESGLRRMEFLLSSNQVPCNMAQTISAQDMGLVVATITASEMRRIWKQVLTRRHFNHDFEIYHLDGHLMGFMHLMCQIPEGVTEEQLNSMTVSDFASKMTIYAEDHTRINPIYPITSV